MVRGIGSLWVSDVLAADAAFPGNMFVPINLLKPVLGDLIASGRSRQPARARSGLFAGVVAVGVLAWLLPLAPGARAASGRHQASFEATRGRLSSVSGALMG